MADFHYILSIILQKPSTVLQLIVRLSTYYTPSYYWGYNIPIIEASNLPIIEANNHPIAANTRYAYLIWSITACTLILQRNFIPQRIPLKWRVLILVSTFL